MSEEYYKNLSKWWEEQWDRFNYSLYAIGTCVLLTIIYYIIANTEPNTSETTVTREFLLGIIIHTIPTLIILIVSFVLFKRILDKKAEREKIELLFDIEELMRRTVISESEFREMLYQSGLQGIYEHHRRDTVLKEIGKSHKEVGILHTYLVDPNSFEQAFVEAAHNGARIRILLLDPDSAVARQRSIDMWPGDDPSNADERYVPSHIRLTVDEFRRIYRAHNLENLEIRLYDALLSVQIFRCDEDLYLGYYPKGKQTIEAVQLKFHGYTYVSRQFLNEFDLVWEKATPVALG